MNLLFVTQQMDIGGAETHIVNLCREMVLRGHAVTVVSAGGQLVTELESLSVVHHTLPLHKKDPFSYDKNYRGLKKILTEGHFDLVNSHARIPSFVLSRLSRKIDFRWVSTCHGIYRDNFITKRLNLWGDATLAVSDDIKTYLKSVYHVAGDRVYPVVNGIDTDRFRPASTRSEAPCRLIAVSRITEQTVQPLLVLCRVIPDIARLYPNLTLTIVGDGTAMGDLRIEAILANQKLRRAAVNLVGAQTDIAPFLRDSDLFIGVSRSAYEAMSCALPVILSGPQGYSGILTSANRESELAKNYCCRGTTPATEAQIAEDIVTLLKRPELCRKLGEENRRFVQEHLSSVQMADMYEDLYSNLPLRICYPHPDIVLSGYFGFQNTGDDETIRSFLQEVSRSRPQLKVLVLANSPKKSATFYQVRCFNRYRLLSLLLVLRKTSLFVACGGSLLQDATSVRSLLYYSSLFSLASAAGCKSAIYAAGIGPLSRRISQKIVARIARSVDYLSLRDEGSAHLIRSLCGSRTPCAVTTDTVFLSAPVNCGTSREFGLSLRYSKIDFPDVKQFRSFLVRLGNAVEQLRQRTGMKPLVLVMHPTADEEISREFADTYHLTLITGSEVLSAAHRCSFVISMRLHTLLFAVTEGHLALGLSSDPKVQNLLFPFSLPTVAPMNFDADSFVSLILYLLEEKRFSRTFLTGLADRQRALAQEDFLRLLSILPPPSGHRPL